MAAVLIYVFPLYFTLITAIIVNKALMTGLGASTLQVAALDSDAVPSSPRSNNISSLVKADRPGLGNFAYVTAASCLVGAHVGRMRIFNTVHTALYPFLILARVACGGDAVSGGFHSESTFIIPLEGCGEGMARLPC
jgi:hypothetical protein